MKENKIRPMPPIVNPTSTIFPDPNRSVRKPFDRPQHRTPESPERRHARNQRPRPPELILDRLEKHTRRLIRRPRTQHHIERPGQRNPPSVIHTPSRPRANRRNALLNHRQSVVTRDRQRRRSRRWCMHKPIIRNTDRENVGCSDVLHATELELNWNIGVQTLFLMHVRNLQR